MLRFFLLLACFVVLSPVTAARAEAARWLPDSTRVEGWRLENGLEVRVRQVPGARNVAIALAYRAGKSIEPAERPGLAALLADLQYTCAAGDIPERSLAEMNSLRPLGWGVTTNGHVALLTEVASAEQFPGVLRQVAIRARGVQVSDSSLARSIQGVRRVLGERVFGNPEVALYERLHDLTSGLDDAQILARASGRGLAGISVAKADSLLERYYVPANACLVLAGDFGELDLHRLLAREFGSIPGGTAQAEPPSPSFVSSSRVSLLSGLAQPIGAMAIASPALEDTLHPTFYLATLIMGGWWKQEHEPKKAPFASYFQYSLLEDPELARFDFDVAPGTESPDAIRTTWNTAVEAYASLVITGEVHDAMRRTVGWILGGALPPNLREQATTSPQVLATLANGMATRAVWRGDAFWDTYRTRFERAKFSTVSFRRWLQAPEHQSVLLLRPKS